MPTETDQFESHVATLRNQRTFFAANRPIHIARSPGRLDVMGGNVDYTGGLVFQSTIREATWAAVQLRPDNRLVFFNPQLREQGWRDSFEVTLDELSSEEEVRRLVNQSPELRWTSYVLGIFFFLKNRYPAQAGCGANIYIESRVPLNKGVSSSAAVEVAVMKAAVSAYGVALAGIELAEACQWCENAIAESACGIMDQAAAVLGDEGHMLPLLCQPCVPYPLVQLPADITCWGIDSGVSHAVTGIEYEAARAAAFMGYKLICDREGLEVRLDRSGRIPRYVDPRWNGYLSDLSPSLFRSRYERELPEFMTASQYSALTDAHVDPFTTLRPEVRYRVRACTRYAVEEGQRIRQFVELARGASSESAWQLMGELMYQSNYAYTECGLGCEAIDELVELVRQEGSAQGLYGAKVTGGGAGGSVVVLGRKDAGEAFRRVVANYARSRGFSPYIFEGSSAGADRFGVTVLAD